MLSRASRVADSPISEQSPFDRFAEEGRVREPINSRFSMQPRRVAPRRFVGNACALQTTGAHTFQVIGKPIISFRQAVQRIPALQITFAIRHCSELLSVTTVSLHLVVDGFVHLAPWDAWQRRTPGFEMAAMAAELSCSFSPSSRVPPTLAARAMSRQLQHVRIVHSYCEHRGQRENYQPWPISSLHRHALPRS
jgi:hypothetical protein